MQNDHYNENGSDQLLTWVPRLRRYARALAGNRDDADDLVPGCSASCTTCMLMEFGGPSSIR